MIASAFSGASNPRSLFTWAHAPLSSPRARVCVRSRPRPEIGKFSTARWVCARHSAVIGTRTSPMVSCSMRYSTSWGVLEATLTKKSSLMVGSGQRLVGVAVAGEIDGGVFVELGQPVVCLDHAHGARLAAHDDRLCGASATVEMDTVEQVTVSHTGSGEEHVVAGHHLLGREDLVEVVAPADCLLALFVVFRPQLGLDRAAHAADGGSGDDALRGATDPGQHVG